MALWNDKQTLISLCKQAGKYFDATPSVIEKDYYVTLFLKELVKRTPYLLFKGGTSLSKCYKVIDRFSEDIDLTLDQDYQSESKRRGLKSAILEICDNLSIEITNIEMIKSRRDYNCYKIDYSPMFKDGSINPLLLVETVFMIKSFPYEIKSISSMIYEYLLNIGRIDLIEEYGLEPFNIHVQTLERTLVDKVFAICDYFMGNKVTRNSRHIYDIYKLLPKIKLDDNLKSLAKEIRTLRKDGDRYYSAKDGISIPSTLKEIIDTNFYKKDYENVTTRILSKPVSYEDAIKSIQIIIENGIFDDL